MSEPASPVIDTHTHVVSPDRSRFPLETPDFPAEWVRESPVAVDGLLAAMDAGGVQGAVLVQAKGAYGYNNSYVAEARAADPARLVNAAVIDLAPPIVKTCSAIGAASGASSACASSTSRRLIPIGYAIRRCRRAPARG